MMVSLSCQFIYYYFSDRRNAVRGTGQTAASGPPLYQATVRDSHPGSGRVNISAFRLQTSYQLDEEEANSLLLDDRVGDPDHSIGNQVNRVVLCSRVQHSIQFPS